MSGMVVRLAMEADLAGVLALERETAEAPHWAEAEYRAALPDGGGVRRCLLVAEVEGRLAGFAVGKVAAGAEGLVGELESVAVADSERRRGVGRALCLVVVMWCRHEGARTIELEVRAQGVAAIGLYEGLGFREVGRRRGYYRGPVDDAVLMEMGLEG